MVQFACNLYSAYWVQFPWCFMGVGREFILLPRDVGTFVDFFFFFLPLHFYSDLNYSFRVSRHKNKETTLIELSSLSSFHFDFTHTLHSS